MDIPLNITTRDVELPPALEDLIRRRAEKLERHFDHLVACRVVVEGPGRHHQSGGPFKVRLDISVPGDELVVDQQPAEDLRSAVQAAFGAAERRVEGFSQLVRGAVKTPERSPTGAVVGLFPDAGYGFIGAAGGREVYFHRNAVLDDGFGRLSVGTQVRFAEEQGFEGPQASTVEVIGDPVPAHDERRVEPGDHRP